MNSSGLHWELTIVDAAPPARLLNSLAVGDIDQDGRLEIVVGGQGGLLWYRPATYERGVIAGGDFTSGLCLADIDRDGALEIVTGEGNMENGSWGICWYKRESGPNSTWQRFVIDNSGGSYARELTFADVNQDGRLELVANIASGGTNRLVIYIPSKQITAPWELVTIAAGFTTEGLSVSDLDGDGWKEIILGPQYYHHPVNEVVDEGWKSRSFAPDTRDKCRSRVIDINHNGKPDILLIETGYQDGKVSWFENTNLENGSCAFIEHIISKNLSFAQTLEVWNENSFFIAEAARGHIHAPYNFDARLMRYTTLDHGLHWESTILDQGSGTQNGAVVDVDGDGQVEIIGLETIHCRVQLWKEAERQIIPYPYAHRFIDLAKPYTGIELLIADVDEDGVQDILCGAWWYKNPDWTRYEIPNIYQVVTSADIDRDGRLEYIAIRRKNTPRANWYEGLNSELVWIKPVDAQKGRWEEHFIGTGCGDWPHGSLIAPLLPGNKLALLVAYHSAYNQPHYPEIFEVPDDPTSSPWPKRTLAKIRYSENFEVSDIDGDGVPDIVAGVHWLKNLGNGSFELHRITADEFDVARCVVADFNGDGKPDILVGEWKIDVQERYTPPTRLVWYENPGVINDPWKAHVVDLVRYPHSIAVTDLNGDGLVEIVWGEHDPFRPYNTRGRIFIYDRAEPSGKIWKRAILDDRFEHHCGIKWMDLGRGQMAIFSHAWAEGNYVHLWEPVTE